MTRVLITGGAGFIGANLARTLQREKEVLLFDNLSQGLREYVPESVSLVEGDIRDTERLMGAMRNADVVVHLAASGSVVDSMNDPGANFSANVSGTLSVLEAARHARVRKLIFASTGGALMGNTRPPVDEQSLPKPISPYGASKLCGEAYCHAYAHAYGVNTLCLRFANIYGPFSAHKKGVITQSIKRLLRGEPLIVYGDGNSSRDYLHVSDLCSGIAAAIAGRTTPGEIFHLASGVETSILDLLNRLKVIAGRPRHGIEFLPARSGEVDRTFASHDKATRSLGFAPAWTLDGGLRETFGWFATQAGTMMDVRESDA